MEHPYIVIVLPPVHLDAEKRHFLKLNYLLGAVMTLLPLLSF